MGTCTGAITAFTALPPQVTRALQRVRATIAWSGKDGSGASAGIRTPEDKATPDERSAVVSAAPLYQEREKESLPSPKCDVSPVLVFRSSRSSPAKDNMSGGLQTASLASVQKGVTIGAI